MGRMAVHDALDVRSLFVDFQMEQGFARSLLDAGDLLSGHIDRGDVLRFEKAFAVHGRCAEDFIVADANRDVSIVRCCEAFVVQTAAHFADVLLDLMCVDHVTLLGCQG